jgi:hypothetical protein
MDASHQANKQEKASKQTFAGLTWVTAHLPSYFFFCKAKTRSLRFGK